MKRKLCLIFLNADGSKERITLHHVAQNLSPHKVYEAMKRITALEIFEKNGLQLMTEVYGAKYIGKKEERLFCLRDPADLENFLVMLKETTEKQLTLQEWLLQMLLRIYRYSQKKRDLVKRFLVWQNWLQRKQVSFVILYGSLLW